MAPVPRVEGVESRALLALPLGGHPLPSCLPLGSGLSTGWGTTGWGTIGWGTREHADPRPACVLWAWPVVLSGPVPSLGLEICPASSSPHSLCLCLVSRCSLT